MLITHTNQLFFETAPRPEDAPYTLKDSDYQGRPSLYRLYMETADLGEYEFATKYLVSYDHWTRLCDSYIFKHIVPRWRRDLQAKLKSEAWRQIQLESLDPKNRNYFSANKMLESLGKEDTKKTKGRPKKEPFIDTEYSAFRIKEDAERILKGSN
jgi:hypothetical protein